MGAVIHMSLDGSDYLSPDGLTNALNAKLQSVERYTGVSSTETEPSNRLFEIIEMLYYQTGMEVVLLVDDCDKPVLDAFNHPDIATANRDQLASFYGVIKDVPDMIHFSFFTGVGNFAHSNPRPGMINVEDITIERVPLIRSRYPVSRRPDVVGAFFLGYSPRY